MFVQWRFNATICCSLKFSLSQEHNLLKLVIGHFSAAIVRPCCKDKQVVELVCIFFKCFKVLESIQAE